MQDKELDKLINDAANQHHPPYNDEDWGKMLVLLDKHLPEKKDRRRPVIFWLLFLLLGGGITLGILQPWSNRKNDNSRLAAAEKKYTETPVVKKEEGDHVANNNANTGSTAADQDHIAAPADKTGSAKNSKPVAAAIPADSKMPQAAITEKNKQAFNRNITTVTSSAVRSSDAHAKNYKQPVQQKGKSVIKVKQPAPAEDDDITANTIKQQSAPAENISTEPTEAAATVNSVKKPVEANSNTEEKATVASKEKEQPRQNESAIKKQEPASKTAARNTTKDRSFTSNFALSFSTGADMSFADLKNPGKIKMFYGAGAAYNIGKHIRVSSGFYVSKKVYYAEPYQYKFPNGAVYPHLTGIDADCKVYEIPVSVYYSFKQHNRHNFYAGTGVSSFLMKTENYKYLYQTPAGQSYSYTRSITDENKHYFSVITLSGGYQYNFNKRISLAAEPYFKLPLVGVGAGKIKLNSSGVLISAFVKPFTKSK